MSQKTLLQLRTLIRGETDLENEPLVDDTSLNEFINEAVQVAEANILTLYEDYFLTRDTLSLVSGTQVYDLPTDLFADKLRGVTYRNGVTAYPVNRLRGVNLFEKIAAIEQFGSSDDYQYLIRNDSGGTKFMLLPTSRETGAYITRWYIRQAKRLVADSDVCDIPQFYTFVKAYGKFKCAELERSPMLDQLKNEKDEQLKLMVDTLAAMVPDSKNEIQGDMSHYEEHA